MGDVWTEQKSHLLTPCAELLDSSVFDICRPAGWDFCLDALPTTTNYWLTYTV